MFNFLRNSLENLLLYVQEKVDQQVDKIEEARLCRSLPYIVEDLHEVGRFAYQKDPLKPLSVLRVREALKELNPDVQGEDLDVLADVTLLIFMMRGNPIDPIGTRFSVGRGGAGDPEKVKLALDLATIALRDAAHHTAILGYESPGSGETSRLNETSRLSYVLALVEGLRNQM